MTASASENWTDTEELIWAKLTEISSADFLQDEVHPVVSAESIRDILLDDGKRKQIKPPGLQLAGVTVTGDLDLAYADISCLVVSKECQFDANIIALGIRCKRDLSFQGCRVAGDIELEGARIDGMLHLGLGFRCANLNLRYAQITSEVHLEGANNEDDVTLHWAQAGQVSLNSSSVAGSLEMDGIAVRGELKLGVETDQIVGTGAPSYGMMHIDALLDADLDLHVKGAPQFIDV